MKYVNENYGRYINFKGTCLPEREREIRLRDDKNRFVRFACRLRFYKKQIKSFQGYINDPISGTWILEMTATKWFHKRLKKALLNPKPYLEKWDAEDKKKYQKALRKAEKAEMKKRKKNVPTASEKPADEA